MSSFLLIKETRFSENNVHGGLGRGLWQLVTVDWFILEVFKVDQPLIIGLQGHLVFLVISRAKFRQ
jgi:hypothetical protein